MAAAFDFLKFLDSAAETWKKQALRDKYCIQNEFKMDKEVISRGLSVIDWRQSSIHHCIENIQELFNKPSKSSSKSTASAEESRQKGNKLFQKKDYRGALQFYTKSVHLAPHDGSKMLALAHANRSAALFHLGSYKACIQDVDEAIAQGYPPEKHFKVLQRKGQCFMKLRYFKEAQEAFSHALRCLDGITAEDKKIQEISTLLQESINPSVEDQLEALDLPIYNTDGIPGEEIKERSSRLMNASSAVTLRRQEGKGRYLEASKDITVGELLIKEKPFAAIVVKEEETSHCHYCFVPCSPIPCPNCTYARYCSPTCKTECWNRYHNFECSTHDLLQQVSVFSLLSLRILITAGREDLSEHINKLSSLTSSSEVPTASTSTSTTITQTSSSSCFDDGSMVDYQAIVGLEAHWFNHSHLEFLQYAVTSIFLAKCFYQNLVLPETLGRLSEEELVIEIASLHLLHTRQLKSNSHAITKVWSSKGESTAGKLVGGTVQEISQVRLATAVYPAVSLMNHACQPNVIASFNRNVLSVRATENIKCGEEIQHCYGPQVSHMTTSDRQQALLDQYCFTCRCRACRTDTKRRNKGFSIKCPACGQPMNMDTSRCIRCAIRFDMVVLMKEVSAALSRISELRERYSSAEKDKTLMRDVISKMNSCIDVLERIVDPPDMCLAETYDFMAKCHVAFGDYLKAGLWLAKCIPTLEWRYGRDSIEVANELFKLAQLHFNGQEFKPAMEVIDRALKLFTRHYGNNNDEVMELMKMKACLMTL